MMVAVVLGAALTGLRTQPVNAADTSAIVQQTVQEIARYCQVCWRNARLHPDCWADCTQEVFARLLERVPPQQWTSVFQLEGEERREFLRAIDAVKKRTQRARKAHAIPEDLADYRANLSSPWADERESVERAARQVLSPRQQRIVHLTAHGWTIPEIAAELRSTVERISDEKYKAIRKLRRELGVSA